MLKDVEGLPSNKTMNDWRCEKVNEAYNSGFI